VSTDRLIELIASIGNADAKTLFEQVEALAQYSPDYLQITAELLSLLHRIAMVQSVPGSIDESVAGGDRISELSTKISAEQIQLYYQIGQHARRDMPYSSDQREAFDMALLRMIAFAPQTHDSVASVPQTKSATTSGTSATTVATANKTANPASAGTSVVDDSSATTDTNKPASSAPVAKPAQDQNNTAQTESAAESSAGSKKNSVGRQLAAQAIAAANAPDAPIPATSAQVVATPVEASAPKVAPAVSTPGAMTAEVTSSAADTAGPGEKVSESSAPPVAQDASSATPKTPVQAEPVAIEWVWLVCQDSWQPNVPSIRAKAID